VNTSATNRSAQREINVPAEQVFDLLATPGEHHRFDATAMVGGSATPQRLSRVGDIFTMEMTYRGGDEDMHYRTDNHVTVLDEQRCVEWAVASHGKPPFGWRWRYDLEPTGAAKTRVTLTYDWTDTPQETMSQFGVPLVTEDQLAASLSLLAKATENA
jgi:hypothetical protein